MKQHSIRAILSIWKWQNRTRFARIYSVSQP